ncbi:MAG: helix-turn-helix domain-containing protein [Candidatus Hydrogenedentales bacterium]|jgi:hypothetical protein
MEKDILTIEDIADLLGTEPAEVLELFRSGEIPGRKIGNRWYATHRQLLDYIEQGPQQPAAHVVPSPVTADHSWTCDHCDTVNNPERVACVKCNRPRTTPLINYIPFRRTP